MEEMLHTLETLASVYSDGHYTVMRFTTDWAVGLLTVQDQFDIEKRMYHGKTLNEAVCRLIRDLNREDRK